MISALARFAPLLTRLKGPGFIGTVVTLVGLYGSYLYYSKASTEEQLKVTKANADQVLNVLKTQTQDTRIMIDIEKIVGAKTDSTIGRYHELQKHVTNPDISRDDWLHYHNTAVPLPRTTNSTGGIIEAYTGVQRDKTELEVITDNYRNCQLVVDRLEGWKLWYERLENGRR